MQNMDSNGIFNFGTVGFPHFQRNTTILIILLSKEVAHEFGFLVTDSCLFLPDLEGALRFLSDTFGEKVPCFVNGTSLLLVSIHLVIEVLAPSVENAGLDLIALNHVRDVDVLVPKSQWLKCTHIPLMKCSLLPVHTDFVAYHTECLQLIVAVRVEV